MTSEKEAPPAFTLHRYFIWANRMRTHFDSTLQPIPTPDWPGIFEPILYMSYWYGGLYVVIEGWKELGLRDPVIDDLLDSPNVDLLRRYRNGVFHFQKRYFDDRFLAMMAEGEAAVVWVRELNSAFGRWFLEWVNQHDRKPE